MYVRIQTFIRIIIILEFEFIIIILIFKMSLFYVKNVTVIFRNLSSFE